MPRNRRNSSKKFTCFLNRHIENLGDGFSLVMDFKGFAVVARTMTHFTRHIHIWQEVHFDLKGAVSATGLTTATFDVETESPRLIPANLCFLGLGK